MYGKEKPENRRIGGMGPVKVGKHKQGQLHRQGIGGDRCTGGTLDRCIGAIGWR